MMINDNNTNRTVHIWCIIPLEKVLIHLGKGEKEAKEVGKLHYY